MKQGMRQLLEALSSLRGVSGFEYRITDKVLEYFKPYADEVYTDTLNNVIAVKRCGIKNAPSIMIEAHMDEIGLMVTSIDEDGFLSFVNIGGIDTSILPGCEVIVHGKKDFPGVIGAKPPHLQSRNEADKRVKMKDMRIDLGFLGESASELVSVGDAVTLCGEFTPLLGTIVSAKTMDDRASVAALVKTFEALSHIKTEVDVYAVLAVCEEVGSRGAKTAGFSIKPDMAIAVDVTHGITPDNSKNAFELGSGTAISKGPNIHPAMSKRLIDTAKRANIKYTVEVEGGDTGTDAWELQVAGVGVPTALLSIPLRYMHTTVETLDINDVYATSDLLTHFIAGLDSDLEGWLCI